MGRGSATLVLRRAAHLDALRSPCRCGMVQDLSLHGPDGVSSIARRLGRVPEGLYHHLRILVRCGLVVSDGVGRVGRRSETLYRLAAPRMRIDPHVRSAAYRKALGRSADGVLRAAARSYKDAVQRGGFSLDGPQRNLAVRVLTMRLNNRGLAELNRLLDRLVDRANRLGSTDGERLQTMTLALVPTR